MSPNLHDETLHIRQQCKNMPRCCAWGKLTVTSQEIFQYPVSLLVQIQNFSELSDKFSFTSIDTVVLTYIKALKKSSVLSPPITFLRFSNIFFYQRIYFSVLNINQKHILYKKNKKIKSCQPDRLM